MAPIDVVVVLLPCVHITPTAVFGEASYKSISTTIHHSRHGTVVMSDQTYRRYAVSYRQGYMELEPAFVANFDGQGVARFLQVSIQLMAYDQDVLDGVKQHMPVIRNNILLLLGNQQYNVVRTREGKEQLQAAVLGSVQDVLGQEGLSSDVQAVYFTSFIMQ